MFKKVEITVHNNLVEEKRDLSVYHHAARSANLIGSNSKITLAFKTTEKNDYVHLSLVQGPGKLNQECVVDLPFWLDFDFSSIAEGIVRHTGKRTQLTIPPSPPVWQVKVTRSAEVTDPPAVDYIIIGDSGQLEGE